MEVLSEGSQQDKNLFMQEVADRLTQQPGALDYGFFLQHGMLDRLILYYNGEIPTISQELQSTYNVVTNQELEAPVELTYDHLKSISSLAAYLPSDRKKEIISVVQTFCSSDMNVKFKGVNLEEIFKFNEDPAEELGDLNVVISVIKQFSTFYDSSLNMPDSEYVPLLNSLAESLFFPLCKSMIYKEVSKTWTDLVKDDNNLGKLRELIEADVDAIYEEQCLTEGESDTMPSYLTNVIAPMTKEYFGEIAEAYPTINYFKKSTDNGKKKVLLMHQVEAINLLMKRDANGLLADEPGTGKTLTLALTALNHIDKKIAKQLPVNGRVLVVGGLTTIQNWSKEISNHIDDTSVEVVNLSDTSEYKYTHDAKSKMLNDKLSSTNVSDSKQIVLVNYDTFRSEKFISLINEYEFDSIIVDEAHNVKVRDTKAFDGEGYIAKRSASLYDYILSHPDLSVMLATATPVVKDPVELLHFARLIDSEYFTLDKIRKLSRQPEEIHREMRSIMLRRRKEEIAHLPAKRIDYMPLDIQSIQNIDKFFAKANSIMQRSKEARGCFYELLSHETLIKVPWLIEKVKELTSQNKKVIIFTPFVDETSTNVGFMSTRFLASQLLDNNIYNVGILDGSIEMRTRLENQKRFLLSMDDQNSLNVLVGNYATAGESITLCSQKNNATEVIFMVCPDMLSKLIQSMDRVHRIGQKHDVTIHIPFLYNGDKGHPYNPIDERIVGRINSELVRFMRIVDGLYVQSRGGDIYTEIIKEIKSNTAANYFYSDNFTTSITDKYVPLLEDLVEYDDLYDYFVMHSGSGNNASNLSTEKNKTVRKYTSSYKYELTDIQKAPDSITALIWTMHDYQAAAVHEYLNIGHTVSQVAETMGTTVDKIQDTLFESKLALWDMVYNQLDRKSRTKVINSSYLVYNSGEIVIDKLCSRIEANFSTFSNLSQRVLLDYFGLQNNQPTFNVKETSSRLYLSETQVLLGLKKALALVNIIENTPSSFAELIWDLDPQEKKLVESYFISGDSLEKIASKMNASEDYIRELLTKSKIVLWDKLFNEVVNNEIALNDLYNLYHSGELIPENVQKSISELLPKFNSTSKKILNYYFGLDGGIPSFNIDITAEKYNLPTAEVESTIENVISFIREQQEV